MWRTLMANHRQKIYRWHRFRSVTSNPSNRVTLVSMGLKVANHSKVVLLYPYVFHKKIALRKSGTGFRWKLFVSWGLLCCHQIEFSWIIRRTVRDKEMLVTDDWSEVGIGLPKRKLFSPLVGASVAAKSEHSNTRASRPPVSVSDCGSYGTLS